MASLVPAAILSHTRGGAENMVGCSAWTSLSSIRGSLPPPPLNGHLPSANALIHRGDSQAFHCLKEVGQVSISVSLEYVFIKVSKCKGGCAGHVGGLWEVGMRGGVGWGYPE
jgi:hypothetical protein